MTLSSTELMWSLIIAFGLAGTLAYLFWKQNKEAKAGKLPEKATATAGGTLALRLQAYERLSLLADRIALPSLISRTNQQGISAREMQAILVQTIRQEFEHNITQQIYVSNEAWDAVRSLKDQNLHIINQIASYLPPEASGTDLNKSLLELIMQNPKASLHSIVSDAISYEAKKIMD